MQVKIPCSNCGKALKVLPEHLGRRARCPYCQSAIVLQAPADYVEPAGHAAAAPPTDGSHEARQEIVHALQEHTASLHEWTNHIETLGSVVAKHITDGWDKVQQRLDESQKNQAEQVRALLGEVQRKQQETGESASPPALSTQHSALISTLADHANSLRACSDSMSSIGSTVAQQLLTGWDKIQQRLDESHQQQLREIRTLLAETSQEKQQVLEQARAVQEAQSKQSAATVAALAETAERVRDEVLQLHEIQACGTSTQETAQSQEVREAMISSLRQHATSLREWSGEIGTLGAVLAHQIVEGWGQIQNRLDQSHQQQMQEFRTLLAEAGQEKKDLLDQSRSIQEAQLHQAAAAAASLAETAVKVHEQVLDLHAKQAQGTKELAGALASELRTVQGELLAQNQKQLEAGNQSIRDLAAQSAQALAQVAQQAQCLPKDLTAALQAFGAELRQQLQATAGESHGMLQAQATSLGDLGHSFQQSAERMTALPEQMAKSLGVAGDALAQQVRDAAKEGQDLLRIQAAASADLSATFQQSARQIATLPTQIGESLNACAAELRRQMQLAAREGEQAFRTQVAAMAEMAKSFQDSLRQTTAIPAQLTAALDAYRAELHQRAQSAGEEAAEAFRGQLALVGEVGNSIQQSAREFSDQIVQIRAAYAAELTQAMQQTKETALQLQKELAAGQEQSTSQLEQLSVSVAVHAQATSRQLAALQQSFDAAATRAMEKLERAKAGADEAGAQRLQRLSAEAESLLTEVYRRSEQVLRQSWELGTRAAAQHEAKLTAVSEQIISALAKSHEAIAQPVSVLTALLDKTNALAPVEQSLTRSLESLTAGDSFKKTLGSIDQSLGRLNRLLQLLADQAGLPPEALSDEKQERAGGWLRRHLAKGGS